MAEKLFDLIIVGGGPGGYVAAIRASQLGLKTAVVEREHLGGICLNWGCIPTKALLSASEIYGLIGRADEFGLSVKEISFDIRKVVKRSRDVAKRLSAGVKHLLDKHKATVIDGHGRLAGKGKVAVVDDDGNDMAELAAKHILLATGARPLEPPGLEPDGELVWTYKEAMVPETMPRSLLIVGSGAIGIEFASFYRAMGADVTVVELLPTILPAEDAEISALARKAFEKQGIKVRTGAKVTSLQRAARNVTAVVDLGGGKIANLTIDRVILAVGITGNVESIGLEDTKVAVEKGHIVVDQWLRTGEPGVYAIGDVVGPPWLAHKAMHEGVVCVERIAGRADARPLDTTSIPGCTYCAPQIASVGMTEQAAKKAGRKVRVGRFPLLANGKAIALGEPEGMVKTIFDAATGELLGAHLIGPEVTELIHGFCVAKTLETTEADLMRAIFPHPTLSEAMGESVLDAYGRALHF